MEKIDLYVMFRLFTVYMCCFGWLYSFLVSLLAAVIVVLDCFLLSTWKPLRVKNIYRMCLDISHVGSGRGQVTSDDTGSPI